MNTKMKIVAGVAMLIVAIGGFLVFKNMSPKKAQPAPQTEEAPIEELPPSDPSIIVNVVKSTSKDNTLVLSVKGLGSKIVAVAYELTYDVQGLMKGVNSGSKPIDTTDKDSFDREVYLGTCSRNVCKPDIGVKKASVVLEFTDKNGKKSQFTKDFDL